jgi:hypothetical protein
MEVMFEDKEIKFVFWIIFKTIWEIEFSKKKKKLFSTLYLKREQTWGPKRFIMSCNRPTTTSLNPSTPSLTLRNQQHATGAL